MAKRLTFITGFILWATVWAFAQQITIDWKIINIGQVRQLITNKGPLWPCGYPIPLLINTEFPPGSYEEHIGEAGIWVGAITPQNDTLVTVTSSWNPWGPNGAEFWPVSGEPWDTIWVVPRNQKVDIPYWPGYVGKADKDYVFRYNDYNERSLLTNDHHPLYADVIEVVHAWSAPDVLAQVFIYEYYVFPSKFDWKKMFITYWADPNVGLRSVYFPTMLADDYSMYFPEHKMGVGLDGPGNPDGTAISPIGFKIFPPENIPASALRWTFKWGGRANPPGIVPSRDEEKYKQLMISGEIMENQQVPSGSHFVISFGPIDLAVGDTLHFMVAEILGYGLEGVLKNAEILDLLKERDFNVPAPPPNPPLKVFTDNHKVTLTWYPTEEVNPETYFDPYRADGDTLPFEGYRVYKSTQSIDGPWKLMAEYDIAGDGFGNEIGLQHEFTDDGLLNNVEYYYSVTAFSKEDHVLNWPSLETSIRDNAVVVIPGTAPPEKVGKVAVVPNPYRGDINYNAYDPPWERTPPSRNYWMEQDRRIQFINLPELCEIKIYTLSGVLVKTIRHEEVGTNKGYHDWNLTSSVGQAIASGIYLFTVEDLRTREVQVGKFVIIK